MSTHASSSAYRILYAADDRALPVAVVRKRVKNLNLRVRADGSVTLSIPQRTSIATAQAFLNRRADWIRERVERRSPSTLTPLVTRDASGTALPRPLIPLWGTLVDAADALGLPADAFAAPAPEPTAPEHADASETLPRALDDDELARYVDACYRRELATRLPAVAREMQERMGVQASRWCIRTMTSRWGSCTPRTGAIRINAALAAYPPACLEFVVAHELVHLMEPSHNRRFHTLLDIYCPDNRRIAALLKHPARELATAHADDATPEKHTKR